MKAVTWHGKRDVRVDTVPDPSIQEPTDAIVRITSTGICGSDLHLYEVLGPFMGEGDILGHEPMGIVEEVGSEVTHIAEGRPRGDPVQHLLRPLLHVRPRPAVAVRDHPGHATRAWAPRCSATRSSTARSPAARPSSCACRRPSTGRSRCPRARRDDRFVYLSDVLPTAWQAVEYANIPDGGTVAVFGLGPIGDMCDAHRQAPRRAR